MYSVGRILRLQQSGKFFLTISLDARNQLMQSLSSRVLVVISCSPSKNRSSSQVPDHGKSDTYPQTWQRFYALVPRMIGRGQQLRRMPNRSETSSRERPGMDRRWARRAQCPRAQQDLRSTRALNGRGHCIGGSPGIHAGEDVPGDAHKYWSNRRLLGVT